MTRFLINLINALIILASAIKHNAASNRYILYRLLDIDPKPTDFQQLNISAELDKMMDGLDSKLKLARSELEKG